MITPIRVLIVGGSFARFSVACDRKNKFLVTFVMRLFLLLLPYSPHCLLRQWIHVLRPFTEVYAQHHVIST